MKARSTEREFMDMGPSFYTEEEYADCLKKLFKINKLLGFFKQTVHLLSLFPKDASLVDIGCGGGQFILQLSRHYPEMTFLGLDISETAIALAQQRNNPVVPAKVGVHAQHDHNATLEMDPRLRGDDNKARVTFQLQPEATLALPPLSVDIVLTTLVCHHMDDVDLVLFLQTAFQAARKAVIINDLHRHPVAYWFYKILSPCLFRNRLITHDGLVSIQRSFTRAEWRQLLKQAHIRHYQIKWGFPFRWSVVLWKE